MGLRVQLSASLAAAILLGAIHSAGAQETQLYSFGQLVDDGDGGGPSSGLVVDTAGNLYGTTQNGGANGAGAVFELLKGANGQWTEKVLHSFSFSTTDGNSPRGTLVFDANGNLYGTTPDGGVNGRGTVFELSPQTDGSWKEKLVTSFQPNVADSAEPVGGVIFDSQGNLYGAAVIGGAKNKGTVYELTPNTDGSWTDNILFSFSDETADGSYPLAGVVFDAKGNLYGTTSQGGTYSLGTVFKLSPQAGGTWQESLLHSFGGTEDDGSSPEDAPVLDNKGNLYGTTYGGGGGCGVKLNPVCGTVFELSPASGGAWKEEVVHRFNQQSKDGFSLLSGVILDPKGRLYGTTDNGGLYGYGSVFEIVRSPTEDWPERLVYSFTNLFHEGYFPEGGLAFDAAGNLFGTTSVGGDYGAGTVFEIAAPARTFPPEFTLAAGLYASAQTVQIVDATPHAVIYYTTDGEVPTPSSTQYKTAIKVTKTETIRAIAVASGASESLVASARYGIEVPAATPVFSLQAGTYNAVRTLTISDSTAGAVIYYTNNGSRPSTSSARYTAGIKLTKSQTIKAIAIAPGHTSSAVASAAYIIHLPATATPVISPKAGTYAKAFTAKIACATTNAGIYYTTNGTTPTIASALYTSAGIKVTKSETIKAIAVAGNHVNSAVATAAYKIP